MTYKIFTSIVFIACSPLLFAQERVAISDLGQLHLSYTAVKQVDDMALRSVQAQVSHKTGEAFQLVAPFKPQRHEFLVNNGALVEAGQSVMLLSGSEVHHFMEQFEAAQSMYDLAKKRHDTNQKLFDQKSISNETWLSIAEQYFATKIEYGHFRHFNELVHSIKSEDEIIIKSPLDGYFIYPDTGSILAGELKLGQVLPVNSLRLQAYISVDEANTVKYFETGVCRVAIDEVSQVSEGYFQQLWSEPLPIECQLFFGQNIGVIPHQAIRAYQVPKSSVFSIERESYVLVKQQQELLVTAINIINSNAGFYYVEATTDMQGATVLSSSVAAVQGVLMGFGGE